MTNLEPSVGSKPTDAYLAGFLFESLPLFLNAIRHG